MRRQAGLAVEAHAERRRRRAPPAAARGRPPPARRRSCRDRPAGNQSRQRRAAARPSTSPSFACRAARKRSLHEVAASASARSSSARSGVGVSLAFELQRCRATWASAESLLIEDGDRRHLAVPGLLEDRGEAVAAASASKRSRGANTRQVAKRPTGVAAREQRHAPPLLQLQDAQRMVVERVLVDLEQLVARIGFEDRQQRLAVVAVRVEAGAAQDAVDPAAQQRHVVHRGVIGGRGEQADQAALAGHPAVGVVGLHDHAIHRPAAMDQRGAVGLDDQDVVRRRARSAPSPRRRPGPASNSRTSSRRRMPSAEPGTIS